MSTSNLSRVMTQNTSSTGHRQIHISWKRHLFRGVGTVFVWASFVIVAIAFLSIILDVLIKALPGLKPSLLTEVSNGMGGGLKNAIEGTLVLSLGSLLIAAPVGIAAGIYLSEFGKGMAGKSLRFLSDVLVGVPSIVLGYVGYITMVIYLGWQFSVAAGIITLSIMLLPYIARTTEMALGNIPQAVREAGFGVGAGEGTVIFRILLPGAMPAVMTGLFYALALSMGETAPLIYTAGNGLRDTRTTTRSLRGDLHTGMHLGVGGHPQIEQWVEKGRTGLQQAHLGSSNSGRSGDGSKTEEGSNNNTLHSAGDSLLGT